MGDGLEVIGDKLWVMGNWLEVIGDSLWVLPELQSPSMDQRSPVESPAGCAMAQFNKAS
jgi:hypothetical protein